MNAYALADARDQEIQEKMHWEDLRMEDAMDAVLSRTDSLRIALEDSFYCLDCDQESIALRRFVGSLFTLYHDTMSLTPSVMRFRGALYALVKQHCRAQNDE